MESTRSFSREPIFRCSSTKRILRFLISIARHCIFRESRVDCCEPDARVPPSLLPILDEKEGVPAPQETLESVLCHTMRSIAHSGFAKESSVQKPSNLYSGRCFLTIQNISV